MMRLIDAEELEELFREVIKHIAEMPEMTGDLEHMVRASAMVIEMIKDAPTIRPNRMMPFSKGTPNEKQDVLLYIPKRDGVNQHGFYIGHMDQENPLRDDPKGEGNFWGIETFGGIWHVAGWSYYEKPIPSEWMPLPEPRRMNDEREDDGR